MILSRATTIPRLIKAQPCKVADHGRSVVFGAKSATPSPHEMIDLCMLSFGETQAPFCDVRSSSHLAVKEPPFSFPQRRGGAGGGARPPTAQGRGRGDVRVRVWPRALRGQREQRTVEVVATWKEASDVDPCTACAGLEGAERQKARRKQNEEGGGRGRGERERECVCVGTSHSSPDAPEPRSARVASPGGDNNSNTGKQHVDHTGRGSGARRG